MVNRSENILEECKCMSEDDKEILLSALDNSRVSIIKAHSTIGSSRMSPEREERLVDKLDRVEKMIDIIKNLPKC